MKNHSPDESHIAWLRRHVGTRRIIHIGCVAAVRDDQDRVLVMRRSDTGDWDFPGGSMNLGETLSQVLVREVREETGLSVEPTRLIGLYTSPELQTYTYPNGDQIQGWDAFFDCRVVGGDLSTGDGETLDLAFVPPGEIAFSFPVLNEMKRDLLAARRQARFDVPGPPSHPTAEYYALLRSHIGHAPLLLPGTAACIRDDRGHILLQKRSDCGLWGFPGGGQNLGESATQAVVREVYEETGLYVEPMQLIGAYGDPSFARTFSNGDRVQPVVAFFRARVVGGALRVNSAETLEVGYFPPDRLPSMLHCCQVKARDALAAREAAFFC
jgi:8-oxo-dGTP pyrophosphatase MutT (NUDIX family)